MGRLFRKFFLAFCLAQLTVVLLVGGLFWLKHQAIFHAGMPLPPGEGRPPMSGPPPPHPPHFLPWEPLLAGTLVSLLFSALLARHFAAPIDRLRRTCAAVASGDLHAEPGDELLRRHDELADLAHDFQGMTARIRLLVDGQRRLLHDVSHELRSPLARLQLAIDLMQQQPVRAADSLARIEREAGKMERLVGELLTLSRLEVQVDGDESETFDMAELLIDVVDDARFEAAARGQRIELLGADGVPQAGRYLLLHRALENVVRNALRYSPDDSVVTVTLGQEEGWSRIRVLDQGPGMSPGALAVMFEPFWRGETRRDADGHGLGLAIALRVLEAHGGRIAAKNRLEGGLCVELLLPSCSGLHQQSSGGAEPAAGYR